jgi:hypothetical protein
MLDITPETIYNADKATLVQMHEQLTLEKMKLDKFFSVFLEETEMPDEDDGGPAWRTYNKMSDQYLTINSLINTTKFYMSKYGITSI